MNYLFLFLVQFSGICVEWGEGSWLFDGEGCCWLDFILGIGVIVIGYCYFKVVEVVCDQVGKLVYVQYVIVIYFNMLCFIDWLYEYLLWYLDVVVFFNFGSEVVEIVLCLVCQVFGWFNIIVFIGGFYGCILVVVLMMIFIIKVCVGW